MNRIKKKVKTGIGKVSIKVGVFMFKLNNKGLFGHYLFSAYNVILRWCNMSIFSVVNGDIYMEKTGNETSVVIESDRKGVCASTVMARSNNSMVFKEFSFPDLKYQCYNDVCIRGDSDIVVDAKRGYVISEASYNLGQNEEIVDGLLYRTRQNVCLLRDNMRHPKEKVQSGIMISGKFCTNYYHLIFENLIRLIYLDKICIPSNIPIVVDNKTMSIPSCKRIFEILTRGINREVMLIDDDRIYQFNTLYCINRVNKLPSHSVNPHKPNPVFYSPSALLLLREKLLREKSDKAFPKRIFITRRGANGRHFNEGEVYSVLQNYGFERIAPEQYLFEEQMTLFNGAEYIVSGSGAALTNLLFISEKCTVVCFGRGSYNNPYNVPIFNTIACINGAKFFFFPRTSDVKRNVHVDYEIDCNDFGGWIESLINN